MPFRDDSKREAYRKLLKQEVLKKKDSSLLFKEMSTFVAWIKRNYLDIDSLTANYKFWAADNISFKTIYATTSQSESFNSKLKRVLDKNGTFNNAVKKIKDISIAAMNNKAYNYYRLGDSGSSTALTIIYYNVFLLK